MLLSGLNNIDFSGIGSLSGDLSSADLFQRFRSAVPQYSPGLLISDGMSDSSIRNLISAVLSSYEIRKTNLPADVAAQIADKVQGILLGADPIGVARYRSEISSVVDGLNRDGYALVPIGYAVQNSSSGGPAQSPVYGPPAAGPVYGPPEQTPSGSPGTATAPQQGRPQSTAPNIQRGPLPVRRITRAHVQTPAERKRLLLIIGGFAAIFAVALGLVAARD